jgi:hypothetical protein
MLGSPFGDTAQREETFAALYAAAGCEISTAAHAFRPADNSPSRQHWPFRAGHADLYSALFGTSYSISKEKARKIFPVY